MIDKEMYDRALTRRGDFNRIAWHMQRAMAKKPVCLGFMGGSITKGGTASSPEKCFTSLVTEWWRAKFPKSEISAVNAGIPGTGSLIGVHRVDRDLLAHKPDFVVVEFAVNDFNPMLTETYDSMVRKILRSKPLPGVMLLHMTNENGGGAEELHSRTGDWYDLPMLSLKKAVWPELEAGRMKWSDIEADTVHPNDQGYELVAGLIIELLEEIYAYASEHKVPAPKPDLPDPLNGGDWYAEADIFHSNSIVPLTAGKWDIDTDTPVFGPGWRIDKPGSSIVFETACTNIGIIYYWAGNGRMGRLRAVVDDLPVEIIDAHAEQKGAAAVRGVIIGKHLPPGRHRLKMRVLEESAEGSTGTEFIICAVLVS